MAMTTNLLNGQPSEWALLKRHESEDLFGIQLSGAYADTLTKSCQIIKENNYDNNVFSNAKILGLHYKNQLTKEFHIFEFSNECEILKL